MNKTKPGSADAPKPAAPKKEKVVVATNRKARHDYDLEAGIEAGMVLLGSEIKSIRDHKVNLQDGFVQEQDGELWLMGVHISPYEQANRYGHEPLRPRKLLLHRGEIVRLLTRVREKGFTLVPTQLYLKNGRAKVEIALGRGRKLHDKRDAIGEREAKRDMERALKHGQYD
jgi:SsrA-binding protein